ncbi:hypothetical protein [Candidatus Odyssella acanthamoebae]|nr:hypothetical protein [Candidatus Paracaedibacter acanthamoebae]
MWGKFEDIPNQQKVAGLLTPQFGQIFEGISKAGVSSTKGRNSREKDN